MNYFAHGRLYIASPYYLAGTAVPDWLNVVNRKVRARAKGARLVVGHEDHQIAEVASGILQHHHDDDWFHRTDAFTELSWDFTVLIRDNLPVDDGLRPSFLGHIMVELLLDSVLMEDKPQLLDDYYQAVSQIDGLVVQQAVNLIATKSTDQLAYFIGRFKEVQFLKDYPDDEKLLHRLNQVMQRVKLPALPNSFTSLLPEMRTRVRTRQEELLAHEGQSPEVEPAD
ncbi:MAG: hypothetical protein COA78_33725 [Blastopirellula sp.]|nr:MAG: hypothetical protein COA78_33725 [Blastopirellula sp.]